MNHVHASAMSAVAIFLMVVLVGTFWRLAAMHLADRPLGKAMSVMY